MMRHVDINGYSIILETVKMVSPIYDANFIEYPFVFTVYFNDDVRKTFSFETESSAAEARTLIMEKLNGAV